MTKKLKDVTGSAKKEVVKNLGGRPQIVFTDEMIAELEEVAPYLNYLQIADYFKINPETFYKLLGRDTRLSVAYKKAKARKLYAYGKKLEEKAMGIDPSADTGWLTFYLKTQGRWKENHDQPTVEVNVNTMSESQKQQRLLDVKLYDKYRRDMGFGMDNETAIDADFVVEDTKLLKNEED